MAATRSKARATRASTDGAAWAATQRFVRRGCETCRWGASNPDGMRFIEAALKSKRDGKSSFSLDALLAEVARAFKYPLTVGALNNHYKRGCAS